MITNILSNSPATRSRRGAFTLVEILVAVAILGVLLTVILVPLRLGFNTFAIGKSRSDVQQNAQVIVNQIAADLRKAQFVYPNSKIKGVSDATDANGVSLTPSKCVPASYPPFAAATPSPTAVPGPTAAPGPPATTTPIYDWDHRPYVITDKPVNTDSPVAANGNANYGVCDTISSAGTPGIRSFNNLSRIDMLQQRRDNNGNLMNTEAGQDFIVTYYTRRLDMTKPYDVVDNPIMLFRAQIPFRVRNGNQPGALFSVTGGYNANPDWTQLPDQIGACGSGTNAPTDRSFSWITHNYFGEANLQPLAQDSPTGPGLVVVPGAHTLVTPIDMSLVAPNAASGVQGAYIPELSFREESSDGHRIDRVTIEMTLAQYDQSGSGSSNDQNKAQRVHVSQTIELPNAACSTQ